MNSTDRKAAHDAIREEILQAGSGDNKSGVQDVLDKHTAKLRQQTHGEVTVTHPHLEVEKIRDKSQSTDQSNTPVEPAAVPNNGGHPNRKTHQRKANPASPSGTSPNG